MADFIRQQVQRHSPGKAVVYCATVPQTKALAALLQCDAYHHHATDKDIKMEAFQSGEQSMIVSTSAFGMGVDIRDIRVIIHVDEPRSLLDYGQESGRAGRDGQKSEAIIVLPAGAGRHCRPSWQPRDQKVDEVARRQVWDFMEARCQREVMDGFMDGNVQREGCGSDEEACQGCCREGEFEESNEAEGEDTGEKIRESDEEETKETDDSDDDNSSECESESEGGSEGEGYQEARARKRGVEATWEDGQEFRRQQGQQQHISRGWQRQKQESRRMMEEIRGYLEV
ncbi:hypothetical protein A1O3_10531, partial [Capronia epimyces CBS 606.96]